MVRYPYPMFILWAPLMCNPDDAFDVAPAANNNINHIVIVIISVSLQEDVGIVLGL